MNTYRGCSENWKNTANKDMGVFLGKNYYVFVLIIYLALLQQPILNTTKVQSEEPLSPDKSSAMFSYQWSLFSSTRQGLGSGVVAISM